MKTSRYADTINTLERHRALVRAEGLDRLTALLECRHGINRLATHVDAMRRWIRPEAWRDTAEGVSAALAGIALARGARTFAAADIADEVVLVGAALEGYADLVSAYDQAVEQARAALNGLDEALAADERRLEARAAQYIEAAADAMVASALERLRAAETQAGIEAGLHGIRDMLLRMPQQLASLRAEMADDVAWQREARALIVAADTLLVLVPRVFRPALAEPINGWRHQATVQRLGQLLDRARAQVEGVRVEPTPPPRVRLSAGVRAPDRRFFPMPPEVEWVGGGLTFTTDPATPYGLEEWGNGAPEMLPFGGPDCAAISDDYRAAFEWATDNPPEGCAVVAGEQWVRCERTADGVAVRAETRIAYVCSKQPLVEVPDQPTRADMEALEMPPAPGEDSSGTWKELESFRDDVERVRDATGDGALQDVLDIYALLDQDRAWFADRLSGQREALDTERADFGQRVTDVVGTANEAPKPKLEGPLPGHGADETSYAMVFIKAFVESSLSKIPVYGDVYDLVNLASGLMSGYTLLGDPVEDVWDVAALVLAAVSPFVGRPEAAWAIKLLRRLAQHAKGLPRAALDGLRRLYLAGRSGQAAIEALLERAGQIVHRTKALAPLAKLLDEMQRRLDKWYGAATWSAGKKTAKKFAVNVFFGNGREGTVEVAEKGDDFAVQIIIDGRPVDVHGDPVSPAEPGAWIPFDALGPDTLKGLAPR